MLVRAQIVLPEATELAKAGDAVLGVAGMLLARGARSLQLRDAGGAVAGSSRLPRWLHTFPEHVGVPVQLDASLRDSAAIEQIAGLRFDSVVVSMAALFDPLQVRWALDLLGSRLTVELNTDGDHLFDPPPSGFHVEVTEAVRQLHFQGVRDVLYRDITGVEPPLQRLQQLCDSVGMGVTYAGVVRSVDDVRELGLLDPARFRGVVVGAPLYDGRLDIGEATRAAGPSGSRGQ